MDQQTTSLKQTKCCVKSSPALNAYQQHRQVSSSSSPTSKALLARCVGWRGLKTPNSLRQQNTVPTVCPRTTTMRPNHQKPYWLRPTPSMPWSCGRQNTIFQGFHNRGKSPKPLMHLVAQQKQQRPWSTIECSQPAAWTAFLGQPVLRPFQEDRPIPARPYPEMRTWRNRM